MKLSGIYGLVILACMGCQESSPPAPGHDVRHPQTVVSIADASSKEVLYSGKLARPGIVEESISVTRPAYRCGVEWVWVNADIGRDEDLYYFTINMAALPTTQPQVTKRVIYNGAPMVFYEDENVKITIHPEHPPE